MLIPHCDTHPMVRHLRSLVPLLILCFAPLPVQAAEPASADPYGEFKVGLQSYTLRNFDLPEALKQCEKLGIKYLEGYPRHLPVTTVPAQMSGYRQQLEQAGITLMSYGVVPLDANEAKTRSYFDFAKGVGLTCIVANPQKNKETFDLLEKLVEEYQIPIAIHNHGPGSTYSTVEDVLKWVEGRHPLIGACVDTGHYLRSDQDPVEVIRKLGNRVYDVHLKDVRSIQTEEEKARLEKELPRNRAEQLRKEGKIFTILGEGELNIVGVLRALRGLQYKNLLALEYEENPQNPLSDVELSLSNLREAVAYLDSSETGFVPLWDGKSFANWTANEHPESWKIVDGELVAHGERSHLLYTGPLAPFTNFELKVDVMAEPGSNGGIHFHTASQPTGWLAQGHEAQVNNTYEKDVQKTGSLYGIQPNTRQLLPDNTWWTQHIIVDGKHVIIKVDGKTIVDYIEPENLDPSRKYPDRKLGSGTIALQGHDPKSTVHYRNIRIKTLPESGQQP
ncbi:family 16 glycoside hydrolase [Planctomicrobium sp. SH664]|uniref:family 16 glycoside hydrolase n=1 Tax=Planctomicrobium sp. SH664 TaxID=3448125 RepID=UPI003F5CB404